MNHSLALVATRFGKRRADIRLAQVCDDFIRSAELQPASGARRIFAARAEAPRYWEDLAVRFVGG
jgi:hypothetical protein